MSAGCIASHRIRSQGPYCMGRARLIPLEHGHTPQSPGGNSRGHCSERHPQATDRWSQSVQRTLNCSDAPLASTLPRDSRGPGVPHISTILPSQPTDFLLSHPCSFFLSHLLLPQFQEVTGLYRGDHLSTALQPFLRMPVSIGLPQSYQHSLRT